VVEIPKAMVIEKIRSRGGSEAAERADDELPDKVDLDSDGELLRRFDLDPDELRDEFEGQSPAAT
jgi:hypothetical protein